MMRDLLSTRIGCCVVILMGAARIAIRIGLSAYIPNDAAYKQVSY